MPFGRVLALLFGSGACALVYQIAWQRMFRLVFGASTLASSAVLAIFLGGLGVGGLLLGRRAQKSKQALRLYGTLELGVGACALVSPLVVDAGAWLYYATGGSPVLGPYLATLLRLVVAGMVIGPAAILMGGTLPAAARAVETDEDGARRRTALLYAVNTCGAVCGAVATTFVLFEALGTRTPIYVAAFVNLAIGGLARTAGARAENPVPASPTGKGGARVGDEVPPAPRRLVYAAAAVTGFVFIALELVWYRMLGPILGGTSFTFGLILAVALAGVGVGGWLYAWRPAPPSLSTFAMTAALEALLAALPLALGDRLAVYAAFARGFGALGFAALALAWASVASAMLLPAAMIAGYQFPLMIALLGRGSRDIARQVGGAYACNTFGAIAGALLAGFALVPALGAVGTWRLAVVLLAVLALAALAVGRRVTATAVIALAACVFAALPGPTATWRLSTLLDRPEPSMDRVALRNWTHRARADVVWQRDGIEAQVVLTAHDSYAFFINGKSDGSVSGDRGTQIMSTLLPALLHRQPRSACVVGLGTGMSAGWLGAVDSIERVDVAEIEPDVVEVARAAAAANQNVLANPKVHVFLGDGRELLMTGSERYDVIASEPSNPHRAGVASLFTYEFYRSVERRLAEDGVFAQWFQGYQIDADSLRVALRTLKRVLPYVEVWQTQESDFLFVASRRPRAVDLDELRRKIVREPYRSALSRGWLVEEAEGVLAHFVASDELVAYLTAGDGPVNSDDDNVLEFAFARNTARRRILGVESLLELSLKRGADRPPTSGAVDWARVAELKPRGFLRSAKPPHLRLLDRAMGDRVAAVAAGCQSGDARAALQQWSAGGAQPRDAVEAFAVARALAASGDEHALPLTDGLVARGFVAEAAYLRALLRHTRNADPEALGLALQALAHLREQPLAICGADEKTLRLVEDIGRTDRDLASRAAEALLSGPLAAGAQEALRHELAERLIFAVGDDTNCLRALGRDADDPEWNDWLLEGRVRCLKQNHHPLAEQAAADLDEYRRQHAGLLDEPLLLDLGR